MTTADKTADTIEDHQARCQPYMLRLQMIALDETGIALTWQAVTEVVQATGAILAEAEAAGSDARAAAGPGAATFLGVRLSRLAAAANDAIAAAGEGDCVLAALWCASRATDPGALWANSTGWRLGAPAATCWQFGARSVLIEACSAEGYLARSGGAEFPLRLVARGDCRLEVEMGGGMHRLIVRTQGEELHLFRAGRHVTLRPARTEDALHSAAPVDEGSLLTPLPGTVVAVHVSAGERVLKGAPLITIEAMKMEHTLTAPYAGTIERLPFAVADRVAAGAVLVELSPLAAEQ